MRCKTPLLAHRLPGTLMQCAKPPNHSGDILKDQGLQDWMQFLVTVLIPMTLIKLTYITTLLVVGAACIVVPIGMIKAASTVVIALQKSVKNALHCPVTNNILLASMTFLFLPSTLVMTNQSMKGQYPPKTLRLL